jgi:hypothetical protein
MARLRPPQLWLWRAGLLTHVRSSSWRCSFRSRWARAGPRGCGWRARWCTQYQTVASYKIEGIEVEDSWRNSVSRNSAQFQNKFCEILCAVTQEIYVKLISHPKWRELKSVEDRYNSMNKTQINNKKACTGTYLLRKRIRRIRRFLSPLDPDQYSVGTFFASKSIKI